jgi:hypothetical protein
VPSTILWTTQPKIGRARETIERAHAWVRSGRGRGIDALGAGSAIPGDSDDRLRTGLNQGEDEIELAGPSAL